MQNIKALLVVAFIATAVIGCSTTKQTTQMLTAAGFKTVPATTDQQVAHLKSLPPKKLTMTQREGTPYWTYPDVNNKVLYIGNQAEYQAYQKLCVEKQMTDEQLTAAEDNNAASWEVWGPLRRW